MRHFIVQGCVVLKEAGEEVGLYSSKNDFHFFFSVAVLFNTAAPTLPTGAEGESSEA